MTIKAKLINLLFPKSGLIDDIGGVEKVVCAAAKPVIIRANICCIQYQAGSVGGEYI